MCLSLKEVSNMNVKCMFMLGTLFITYIYVQSCLLNGTRVLL